MLGINPSKKFGAGDRGRTDTVSLPLDFESSTSANSITPANLSKHSTLNIITKKAVKVNSFFEKILVNYGKLIVRNRTILQDTVIYQLDSVNVYKIIWKHKIGVFGKRYFFRAV